MPVGLFASTGSAPRAAPALARDVDDNAVRILELALEVFLVRVVAKVHEKLTAGSLDALLRLGDIVDDEAEMVCADEVLHVGPAGALRAGEVEQRQIDRAMAHE